MRKREGERERERDRQSEGKEGRGKGRDIQTKKEVTLEGERKEDRGRGEEKGRRGDCCCPSTWRNYFEHFKLVKRCSSEEVSFLSRRRRRPVFRAITCFLLSITFAVKAASGFYFFDEDRNLKFCSTWKPTRRMRSRQMVTF